eukprot:11643584-Alexandrium_andersonii.AAC.1
MHRRRRGPLSDRAVPCCELPQRTGDAVRLAPARPGSLFCCTAQLTGRSRPSFMVGSLLALPRAQGTAPASAKRRRAKAVAGAVSTVPGGNGRGPATGAIPASPMPLPTAASP